MTFNYREVTWLEDDNGNEIATAGVENSITLEDSLDKSLSFDEGDSEAITFTGDVCRIQSDKAIGITITNDTIDRPLVTASATYNAGTDKTTFVLTEANILSAGYSIANLQISTGNNIVIKVGTTLTTVELSDDGIWATTLSLAVLGDYHTSTQIKLEEILSTVITSTLFLFIPISFTSIILTGLADETVVRVILGKQVS
jgi:hypothetical protein